VKGQAKGQLMVLQTAQQKVLVKELKKVLKKATVMEWETVDWMAQQ